MYIHYTNDGRTTITTFTSTIHPTIIQFLEELGNVKKTEPTWVCSHCGGSLVYVDAYVGLNDPDDVRTFDATFCDDCEGECSVVTMTEYEEENK